MVERTPAGFIRLTIDGTNEPVLVRASAVEVVRSYHSSVIIHTAAVGVYVSESLAEVAAALSQPNEEGEGK